MIGFHFKKGKYNMKKYSCYDIILYYQPVHEILTPDNGMGFYSRPLMDRVIVPYDLVDSEECFDLFSLLHEIGHCETYSREQNKPTREFLATQWAIMNSKKWHVKLSNSEKTTWQDYIYSFTKAKDKTKYQLDWSPMH